MNNTHLHLVVNHLPIIFPVVGIILLVIGIFTKTEVSKRNSYFIFILGALASIAAMATGEGAEEGVENLPGVAESLIETHEEAAELFAGLSYILGGISTVALFASFRNYIFSKIMPFTVVLFALATLFFAQKAGTTGGEIRHTEISSTGTSQIIGEDIKKESNHHDKE
ncbi:hypothetical protein H1R16_11955 [Marnyiella aurantia]|uniref:Uncharacterized protein n=1 Tax=Marnyiella aurantia TaxID=2758037 RepID=A0A7D7LQC4_9FLAO|nr:hypothetical protein [Marnyiella aurantia]MBA5246228.1 hypothetical protein [Marnyiella aurantia]QMS98394.1 hypothetical protein H1R16_11955 [Marnyiella aurantia]